MPGTSLASLLLIVLTALGCGTTSVTHGPRPSIVPMTRGCAAGGQVQLSQGHATLRSLANDNGTMTYNASIGGMQYSAPVSSTARTSRVQGFTPYVDGERVSPHEILDRIGVESISKDFDDSLRPYRGGKWRAARPVWVGMLIGAGAMLGGGIVSSRAAFNTDSSSDVNLTPTYTLLGGSIALLLGSIPLIALDLSNHDNGNELAARRAFFVLDGELAKSLGPAIERHNKGIADACGVPSVPAIAKR